MSDDQVLTTESIRLAFALSRDGRDMQDYRYDRVAGVSAWDLIRDEAFAVFDAWLIEHDRQVAEKAVIEYRAEPAPWMCEGCTFPFPKESGNPGKWSRCEICNSDEFVSNLASPNSEDAPHE